MPSYKNFRNKFRRNSEGNNLFKIPKIANQENKFSKENISIVTSLNEAQEVLREMEYDRQREEGEI